MPFIVHNHFHQHHTHHYPANVVEQLQGIHSTLETLVKGMTMIAPEIQALLDQSKKNNDVLKSMEIHYDALAAMIGTLQTTISGLQAGAVLSDTDKATIAAQVSDLANTAAAATDDITKNTPLEVAPTAASATAPVGATTPIPDAPSAPAPAAPDAPATPSTGS